VKSAAGDNYENVVLKPCIYGGLELGGRPMTFCEHSERFYMIGLANALGFN
jgi:hypothetical protein